MEPAPPDGHPGGRPVREGWPASEVIGVPVPGGALAVEQIRSATEPVLAIHGISSQRRLWNWLRAAAPGLSLIAPDLRGRGDSVDVGSSSDAGPGEQSPIARHAADMTAVLDRFGMEAAHVCGMSMGGFVAVEMAVSYPDRVKSLILVDGGFRLGVPPGLTRESLPATFADRLARLDRDWLSVSDYAAFFVSETAPLLDPADPLLLDYLAHDLAGRRVRLSGGALIADAGDVFFGAARQQQLRTPARLLTAEWGRGPGTAPAYPAAALEALRERVSALVTVRPVRGVDHAASIMTQAGARATAELIAEAIE